MAMLNFKYGLYKKEDGSLNLPAYSEGTIYVTTDEKAMYADVGGSRIRLGQIITLSTYDWEHLQPPYSEEAFYYVADSNALLKYDGTSWKQINSTKALTESLNNLTARVKTIEDKDYDTQITAINGKITNLEAKDTTLTNNIQDLMNADTAIEARIDGIDKVLNYKGVVEALPVGGNLDEICVYENKVYICTTAGSTNAVWTEWTDKNVIAAIETLKDKVSKMATDGTVTALGERITNLETTVNGPEGNAAAGLVKKTEALESAVFDTSGKDKVAANADAIDDINEKIGQAGDAAGTETVYGAIADAKKAGTDAASALATYKTSNDQAVSTAQSTADEAKRIAEAAVTDDDLADAIKNFATKTDVANAKSEVLGTDNDAAGAATVAGANKAAANAQIKANANAELINSIKDGKEIDSFADVEAKLAALQPSGDYATKTELNTAVSDAKTELIGDSNDTADDNTIYGAKKAAANAAQAAEEAAGAAQTAQNKANEAYNLANGKTTMGEVEAKGYATKTYVDTTVLGDADDTSADKTVYGAHKAAAEALTAANGAKEYAQTTVLGDAADTAADKTVYGAFAAIDALESDMLSKMQVADAMIYKGVVGSAADIRAAEAQADIAAGWTYKANAEIRLSDTDTDIVIKWADTDDKVVRIGDLLIADGTETNGILTTVEWEHVPSGYTADYNPELQVATPEGSTNSANINLISGVETSLGSVTLSAAENSAVTVAASGTNIAIGMAWGTF